jgi:chemosensory pili system protein ChpA (sensor histidine kinase/response regulator)
MSKVIIVEDDTLIARIYENKLRGEGHTVKVASDGVSGLELIKATKPDLVLIDLLLPNMSGIEIVRKLRSDWQFTNLPIIAYSSAEEMLEEVREVGPTRIISKKENSPKEILNNLNELLESTRKWQVYGASNNWQIEDPAGYKFEEEFKVPEEKQLAQEMRERVLIVEDDQIIVSVIKDIVAKMGFEPEIARDGREAYQILTRDSDFVAAIFDIQLPHVSGDDLVRYMHTEKRLMRIPVMMMTSDDSIKIQLDSHAAGAKLFIPKPFERATFEIMFSSLVGVKKAVENTTYQIERF